MFYAIKNYCEYHDEGEIDSMFCAVFEQFMYMNVRLFETYAVKALEILQRDGIVRLKLRSPFGPGPPSSPLLASEVLQHLSYNTDTGRWVQTMEKIYPAWWCVRKE